MKKAAGLVYDERWITLDQWDARSVVIGDVVVHLFEYEQGGGHDLYVSGDGGETYIEIPDHVFAHLIGFLASATGEIKLAPLTSQFRNASRAELRAAVSESHGDS